MSLPKDSGLSPMVKSTYRDSIVEQMRAEDIALEKQNKFNLKKERDRILREMEKENEIIEEAKEANMHSAKLNVYAALIDIYKHDISSFDLIPKSVRNVKKVILAILDQDGTQIQYVEKQDEELAAAAIAQNVEAVLFLTPELQVQNKRAVLLCVEKFPLKIVYMAEVIQHDPDVLITAINSNCSVLDRVFLTKEDRTNIDTSLHGYSPEIQTKVRSCMNEKFDGHKMSEAKLATSPEGEFEDVPLDGGNKLTKRNRKSRKYKKKRTKKRHLLTKKYRMV